MGTKSKNVITVEENVLSGGFAQDIGGYFIKNIKCKQNL